MFSLPDLPYDYSALEPFIDTETMHIHHDKHHATYVKNLNDALMGREVTDIKVLLNDENPKIKNNAGGHYNHSFFWEIMSPNSQKSPSGNLSEAIISTFDSFEAFQEKFSSVALGRFGSGWAWLVSDNGKLSIIDTVNQDTPNLNLTIVLGLDVWEHAYYLKYKNMRADYIKAWWNVVNWDKAVKLYGGI